MGNIRGTHSSPGVYTKMTDKKQIRTRISLIANKNEDVSNISIGGGSSSKTNVTINGNVVEENGLYYVVLNAKPAVLDDITISMDINDEPKQVTMKKGSDTAKSEEVDKYCKIENVTVEPQSTSVAKYSVNKVVNPNGDGLFNVSVINVINNEETLISTKQHKYKSTVDITAKDIEGYEFIKWELEGQEYTNDTISFIMPENDVEVRCYYNIKTFTITWENHDGTVLETDTDVLYGTTPEYNGATPTKKGDDQYSYNFTEWKPTITGVTGNATYTAQFEEITNTYTVTWKNYDGTPLETDTDVPYGTIPTYDGPEPTKEGDAQYTYTFNNIWDPEITEVTGNTEYTAVFTSKTNEYDITFNYKNENGEDVTSALTLEYGTKVKEESDKILPPYYETPESGYTFSGWEPEITEEITVEGPAEYIAQYTSQIRSYTIRFLDSEGRVLQSGTTEYGTTPTYNGPVPTKEQTDEFTYTFIGWDPEITEETKVTGDAEYTAQFEQITKTYTITWNDFDETPLRIDENVPYGTMPSYKPDPTKKGDDQYYYEFSKWDPTITKVTGDAIYKAKYTRYIQKYKITWENHDGTVLETDTDVPYGTTPEYNGATPTKKGDDQYSYNFTEWKPTITGVTGNATYTAQFEEITNTYTVEWLNSDGTILETDTNVAYGTLPSYDGKTPTIEKEHYICDFTGWDKPINEGITGDTVYTAIYSETPIQYELNVIVKNGQYEIEPQKETYTYNEEVTITIIPIEGYQYEELTDKIRITGNMTLTYECTPIKYDLTVNDSYKGQQSYGDDISEYLTYEPKEGMSHKWMEGDKEFTGTTMPNRNLILTGVYIEESTESKLVYYGQLINKDAKNMTPENLVKLDNFEYVLGEKTTVETLQPILDPWPGNRPGRPGATQTEWDNNYGAVLYIAVPKSVNVIVKDGIGDIELTESNNILTINNTEYKQYYQTTPYLPAKPESEQGNLSITIIITK